VIIQLISFLYNVSILYSAYINYIIHHTSSIYWIKDKKLIETIWHTKNPKIKN